MTSDLELISTFIADELQVRLKSYCALDDTRQPIRSTCDTDGLPLVEEAEAALAAIMRLDALINSPETADFVTGLRLEAVHQVQRHGSEHDAGKTPFDWFWLIGYLAQKAAAHAVSGDVEKAKHHTISTAAALANWHSQLAGAPGGMQPGLAEEALPAWLKVEPHRLSLSDAEKDRILAEEGLAGE